MLLALASRTSLSKELILLIFFSSHFCIAVLIVENLCWVAFLKFLITDSDSKAKHSCHSWNTDTITQYTHKLLHQLRLQNLRGRINMLK